MILARGPDAEGLSTYTALLRQGGTILDIRDELMRSDEFRLRRMPDLLPPFGQWLVWPGLDTVMARIMPAPVDATPASFERSGSTDDIGAGLARLVLGSGSDERTTAAWLADHAQAVSDFARRRVPESTARVSPPLSDRPLVLGRPLSIMTIGDAGWRDGDRVIVRPGPARTVAYGPYVGLASGLYRLALTLDVGAPAASGARLVLEVAFDRLLLATRVVRVPGSLTETITLDFTVPADQPALRAPRFEYRLRTDGAVQGTVVDLVLQRLSRTGREAVVAPDVADWLPLMTIGEAASAVGETVVGAPEVCSNRRPSTSQ